MLSFKSAGPWPLPVLQPQLAGPEGRVGLVAKVSGGVDPEAGSSVSSQEPGTYLAWGRGHH